MSRITALKPLPVPTTDLVKEKLTEFDRYNNVPELALKQLIATFPENAKQEHVLLKVAAINSLYSTQIFGVYAAAEAIWEKRIDARLDAGNLDLVNEISRMEFQGKPRWNYSFATKYCSWHRPSLYPIYDSRVDCVLRAYRKQSQFASFTQETLWDYPKFHRVICDFRHHFGLESYGFKELDKFLYQLGGEALRLEPPKPPEIPTSTQTVILTLYAATTNPGKLRDFAIAAADSGIRIEPLPNLAAVPAPEEDQPTFAGNARLKAEYYSHRAPGYVLADDSGLEVDALHGEPGVRSARYAQDAGFEPPTSREAPTIDQRNNLYLLQRMEGMAHRAARYRCVLALARNGSVLATADGSVEGTILTTPRGAGGFGYDPLFFLPELGQTMAEISLEEKHTLSHRGRAFRALLPQLQTLPQ